MKAGVSSACFGSGEIKQWWYLLIIPKKERGEKKEKQFFKKKKKKTSIGLVSLLVWHSFSEVSGVSPDQISTKEAFNL